MSHTSKNFLQLVAQDLYRRCNGDLSHITVVFPGRRASIFLDRYLYEEAGSKALWAPRYTTIKELFQALSPLTLNDPIDTVCRLYRHYQDTTEDHDTTLDMFFGWGERLLADFDDIDKNIAPRNDDMIRQLFTNIADLKELESLDYLSEEQRKVLHDFFHNFSLADESEIRERFLRLWQQMFNIYTRLNEELRSEGLAYEGALFRSVVKSEAVRQSEGTYVFVGHNALSHIEQELLSQLQEEGRAWFYWDYDVSYMVPTNEASHFLRENLHRFPNSLPESEFRNMENLRDVEFVSASTENAQARSVPDWLNQHLGPDPTRTAIVLASENLLQPVLHSLPDTVTDINITKGFPLGHTRAFTLVEHFLSSHDDSARPLTEILKAMQQKIRDCIADTDDLLDTESWYYAHTTINRFITLAESGRLAGISPRTLHKILSYELRQTSVPFEGEPAIGLQIMGVLETRCLDFDNVLILSANEKVLPRVSSDNSFIPYHLRRAFGLTIINHKTAVYAYYFYRLLQRAKHVRCVYNSSADGSRTGEMSRFMTQLMVESDIRFHIRHIVLTATPNVTTKEIAPIPKPNDMADTITSLSPSALNAYMDCPIRFYYQRIRRIRKEQDPADIIAENTFGLIFHKAAEITMKELSEDGTRPITATDIEGLLNSPETLWRIVVQAFDQQEHPVEFNGVIAEVIVAFLRRTLEYDQTLAKAAPLRILGVECDRHTSVCVNGHTISVGGNIDRLDEVILEGRPTMRIVDYKTGGTAENLNDKLGIEQLFTPKNSRHNYLFQTFLYCLALIDTQKAAEKDDKNVTAALYFVNKKLEHPHIKHGKSFIYDFHPLAEEFRSQLIKLIEEILDPSIPFTPHTFHCPKCPYHLLCHR